MPTEAAPRAPRVPRFTLRNVVQAAALMGALWGGGMMLAFSGPFARVTPTQGGVEVDARERPLAQLLRGVVLFALGGVAFGTLMGGVLLLATRKARKDSAALLAGAGLEPGERVLEDGPANRQQKVAVGGWLYLTDRRLIFRPHGMNLGFGSPSRSDRSPRSPPTTSPGSSPRAWPSPAATERPSASSSGRAPGRRGSSRSARPPGSRADRPSASVLPGLRGGRH